VALVEVAMALVEALVAQAAEDNPGVSVITLRLMALMRREERLALLLVLP